MSRFSIACALAALLITAPPALANTENRIEAATVDAIRKAHEHHKAAEPDASASTQAFEEANAKMHADMTIPYTGNADVDFVRGMIPHHQGAIDMAKVLLQYGKDPELQKLGHDIVAAQTKEIAQMEAWLAKHAPAAQAK